LFLFRFQKDSSLGEEKRSKDTEKYFVGSKKGEGDAWSRIWKRMLNSRVVN